MLGIRVDDDVFLRLHQERNADELYRLVDENRAHLRPWFAWVDATTSVANTREFVRETLIKLAQGKMYGFEILYEGALVGAIDVRVENPATAEIGYWLAEKAQGGGIVSRAVRVLMRFSFADLGVDVVVIRCAKDNVRSLAIPERLGFTLTATLPRQEVRGQDQLVYSLPRSQWEAFEG